MDKTKKFFLSFLFVLGGLFLLAGFSLVRVFVFEFEKTSENIISIVYLFLHLIVLAFAFYYAFRAYIYKPSLMNTVMIDEHGFVIKKSRRVAIIIATISLVLVAFSLAMIFGLNKVISFISPGTIYAFLNSGASVGITCVYFTIYPKVHKDENNVKSRE